jgi:acyl-CoA thioester hydrolase
VVVVDRLIQVYETDLMGIVHHSNYLRFFEETRVLWLRRKGALGSDVDSVSQLTVTESRVRYLRPVRYGDLISIDLQARVEGARLFIQYRLENQDRIVCSAGETSHCSVDERLRPRRLAASLVQAIKETSWTETWL